MGVEVGAVAQLGASAFDGLADAGDLVAAEIVRHHDTARPQNRYDELLHIFPEAFTEPCKRVRGPRKVVYGGMACRLLDTFSCLNPR